MKEQILKLRGEGKSYNEIQKELGCSKGTIAYHCGAGQKEKTQNRLKNHRKTLDGILKRKKDNFSNLNRKKQYGRRVHLSFSAEEFKQKIINNSICYLTGRQIDVFKPSTWSCDHIVPVSKGGSANLNNLGVTCKEANKAKDDLSVEKFLQLCKEVLIHNGYEVKKK